MTTRRYAAVRGLRAAAGAAVIALATVSVPAATAAPSAARGGAAYGQWGVDRAQTPSAGSAAAANWTITGAGAGHGVGMSQYGALAQANAGWKAAQILKFYYPGTTMGPAADAMTLVVNVQDHVTSSTVTTSALAAGGGAFTVSAGGVTMSGGASTSVTFTGSGSTVTASCAACTGRTTVSGGTVTMRFADGKTLAKVGTNRFDVGILTVTPSDTGTAVQVGLRVRLHDEYLDRIAEMPWSWPAGALQAQAAAARAYALSKIKDGLRPSCGCHVYNNTDDQVFAGYPASGNLPTWDAWKAAVRSGGSATTGQVPKYAGSVIRAFYSPSNGGWTQSSAEAWGTALPYLISAADPWSTKPGNPHLSWTRTVSGADLAAAAGVSDVARLDLSRRTQAHALGTVYAYAGNGATGKVAGTTFAARLGLPSSWVRHRVERVTGADQSALAAAVARSVPVDAQTVVLVSADPAKLPDAVAAPPLAKTLGAPLLLTDQYALPMPTVGELNRRVSSLKYAVIIGGANSVDQRVLDQLTARGLTVSRIDGADRYEVSKNVALRMGQIKPVTNAVVVGGAALPDAVSVGGPAVGTRSPILFTPAADLGAAAAAAIDTLKPTTTQVVGGPASVSGLVVSTLQKRGITTIRLSGANRYEVSVAVAGFFAPKMPGSKVVLAAGDDGFLMDALLGAPLGRPTVLAIHDHLPSAVARYLQTLNWLGTLTVIGGSSHVDDASVQAAAES